MGRWRKDSEVQLCTGTLKLQVVVVAVPQPAFVTLGK